MAGMHLRPKAAAAVLLCSRLAVVVLAGCASPKRQAPVEDRSTGAPSRRACRASGRRPRQ